VLNWQQDDSTERPKIGNMTEAQKVARAQRELGIVLQSSTGLLVSARPLVKQARTDSLLVRPPVPIPKPYQPSDSYLPFLALISKTRMEWGGRFG